VYDILIVLPLSIQMSVRWRRQIDTFDVVAVAITVENKFQFDANGAAIIHIRFCRRLSHRSTSKLT